MPIKTNQRLRFTIWHGIAASLVVHLALVLPFVMHVFAPRPDEMSSLVIELQGFVADRQVEEKVSQEQSPAPQQARNETASSPLQEKRSDVVPDDLAPDAPGQPPGPQTPTPPEVETVTPNPRIATSAGEYQDAQTIRTDRDAEADRLREYIKRLSKKVQSNLVYPDEGRQAALQGTATVSFALQSSGEIRSETLKIVKSSGQPKLDASALRTVLASAPFAPPPKELTVAIAVGFGRKR